jgi:hypothetical protein
MTNVERTPKRTDCGAIELHLLFTNIYEDEKSIQSSIYLRDFSSLHELGSIRK